MEEVFWFLSTCYKKFDERKRKFKISLDDEEIDALSSYFEAFIEIFQFAVENDKANKVVIY